MDDPKMLILPILSALAKTHQWLYALQILQRSPCAAAVSLVGRSVAVTKGMEVMVNDVKKDNGGVGWKLSSNKHTHTHTYIYMYIIFFNKYTHLYTYEILF